MTTPPLETVSVGTKAPLGRSETSPPSLVDQEGVREAVKAAIVEWLAPYRQEYRPPHDRLCDLIALAVMSPRIEQTP